MTSYASTTGINVGRNGWTHVLTCTRPKGRKAYMIHVEVIGDVIVRTSRPVICPW